MFFWKKFKFSFLTLYDHCISWCKQCMSAIFRSGLLRITCENLGALFKTFPETYIFMRGIQLKRMLCQVSPHNHGPWHGTRSNPWHGPWHGPWHPDTFPGFSPSPSSSAPFVSDFGNVFGQGKVNLQRNLIKLHPKFPQVTVFPGRLCSATSCNLREARPQASRARWSEYWGKYRAIRLRTDCPVCGSLPF